MVVWVQRNIFSARLGGDNPEVTQLLRVLIRRIVQISLDQVLWGRVSLIQTWVLDIEIHLDKAIHASFPASIEGDELASLGVKLGTNQTGIDGGRAGVDQVALSLLGLYFVETISLWLSHHSR